MADFLTAHKLTSINEGGYTNDRLDPGNWTNGKINSGILVGTNHGISAPVLMRYLKRLPTADEMRNLKVETAHEIYRKNYWNLIKGDQIKDQGVANVIYDNAVNIGAAGAVKMAQKEVGTLQTGVMDSKTLKKLNA